MAIWAKVVSTLAGTLPETLLTYYQQKQSLKHELVLTKLQGKIQLEEAKAARKAAEMKHTHDWEMTYINNQATSWKDELVLLVFLWPFVGVFIPGLQDYVLTGYDYLAKVPYWWVGLSVAISLAIYGIRQKNASRISAPGLREEDVESK